MQTTSIMILDDLDGTEGARPVSITVNGMQYTVDLTDANLNAFLDSEVMNAAQPVTKIKGARNKGKHSGAQIRTWALKNGYDVPARGRLKNSVVHAYYTALGMPVPNGAKKATRTKNPEANMIRQWATRSGLMTAKRGRIPASIVQAWNSRNDVF
jgi:Lsr2